MTAQIHEILILEGERTSMAFCPPLPEGHPRVFESEDSASMLVSTACWRGYRGTWEVRDGRFYLVDLQGRFRLREGDPIFADWFSGVLRIPEGELIQYVHMGFGSVHEHELHIKIERGVVVKTRTVDNRGNKHDEWELAYRNLPGSENRFPGDDEF